MLNILHILHYPQIKIQDCNIYHMREASKKMNKYRDRIITTMTNKLFKYKIIIEDDRRFHGLTHFAKIRITDRQTDHVKKLPSHIRGR